MMEDNKSMLGWIICRLRDDVEEGTPNSILNKIYDLSYGVLSDALFPPVNNWVFLASDNKMTSVGHFTSPQIELAKITPLKLEFIRVKDEKYTKENASSHILTYQVSNCPIEEMNGRYIQAGIFEEAPMFQHVRKWTILRCRLPEIPEIGITAEDTYQSAEEERIQKFFSKAEKAFEEITNKSSTIREGSAMFTRKFIDLARAGNKMITMDQALSTTHHANRRRELQLLSSTMLLDALHATATGIHESSLQSENYEQAQPSISTSESTASNTTKTTLHIMDEQDIERALILGKQITFESTQLPLKSDKDIVQLSSKASQQSNTQQPGVLSVETELSVEVMAAIQSRETNLKELRLHLQSLNQIYLEQGFDQVVLHIDHLQSLLKKVANATVDFLEAYGAWGRAVSRAKGRASKVNGAVGAPFSSKPKRTYSVVLAHYGVEDLYGPSKAVNSNVKKFRRNYEPRKKKVEYKYFGEYETEILAVEALEQGLASIPQEQWIYEDMLPSNKDKIKALVTFRYCKKHYLVRSQHVPNDLPCELCAMQASDEQSAAFVYNDDHFPAFLWGNYNYNEKMLTDLLPLQSNPVLKQLFPKLSLDLNPLLLSNELLEYLHNNEKNSKKKKNDPLCALKGKKELLQDAFAYNKSYQASIAQYEFEKQYFNHPFYRPIIKNLTSDDSPTPMKKPKKLKITNSESSDMLSKESNSLTALNKMKSINATLTSSITNINGSALLSSVGPVGVVSPDAGWKRKILTDISEDISWDRLQRSFLILQQSRPLQKPAVSNSVDATSLHTTPTTYTDHTAKAPIDCNISTVSTKTENAISHTGRAMVDHSLPHSLEQSFDAKVNHLAAIHNPYSKQAKSALFPRDSITQQSMLVDAAINEKGVDMKVSQLRFPPIFREEGVFARTDVGEFASFSKGRAVRAFDFQEKLYQEGKLKEEQRKYMQHLLRQAVNVRIDLCNVDYIYSLIDQARKLKSSVLNLDIIQAESFVARFQFISNYSVKLQSKFRGNKWRALYRVMKEAKEKQKKYIKSTQQWAQALSAQIIPTYIEAAMKATKKTKLKILYRCLINVLGFQCIISLFPKPRKYCKPINLCNACKTESLNGRYYPYPETTAPQQYPCTCCFVQQEEILIATFYSPLTSKRMEKEFSLREIRSRLLQFEVAKEKYLCDEVFQHQLQHEKLYEELRPLFKRSPTDENTVMSPQKDNVVIVEGSRAYLSTANVSSVLPGLLKPLSSYTYHVLTSLKGRHCATSHLLTTESPSSISNYTLAHMMDREENDDEVWSWEPFQNLQMLERQHKEKLHSMSIISSHISQFEEEIQVLERHYEESMFAYECAQMKYEDQYSKVFQNFLKVGELQERNKIILSFGRELADSVRQLEQQQRMDYSRSTEGYEDGESWQNMHAIIGMRKRLKECQNELATEEETPLKAKQRLQQASFNLEMAVVKHRKEQEVYCKLVEDKNNLERDLNHQNSMIKEVVNQFFSTYSHPRRIISNDSVFNLRNAMDKITVTASAIDSLSGEEEKEVVVEELLPVSDFDTVDLNPIANEPDNSKNCLDTNSIVATSELTAADSAAVAVNLDKLNDGDMEQRIPVHEGFWGFSNSDCVKSFDVNNFYANVGLSQVKTTITTSADKNTLFLEVVPVQNEMNDKVMETAFLSNEQYFMREEDVRSFQSKALQSSFKSIRDFTQHQKQLIDVLRTRFRYRSESIVKPQDFEFMIRTQRVLAKHCVQFISHFIHSLSKYCTANVSMKIDDHFIENGCNGVHWQFSSVRENISFNLSGSSRKLCAQDAPSQYYRNPTMWPRRTQRSKKVCESHQITYYCENTARILEVPTENTGHTKLNDSEILLKTWSISCYGIAQFTIVSLSDAQVYSIFAIPAHDSDRQKGNFVEEFHKTLKQIKSKLCNFNGGKNEINKVIISGIAGSFVRSVVATAKQNVAHHCPSLLDNANSTVVHRDNTYDSENFGSVYNEDPKESTKLTMEKLETDRKDDVTFSNLLIHPTIKMSGRKSSPMFVTPKYTMKNRLSKKEIVANAVGPYLLAVTEVFLFYIPVDQAIPASYKIGSLVDHVETIMNWLELEDWVDGKEVTMTSKALIYQLSNSTSLERLDSETNIEPNPRVEKLLSYLNPPSSPSTSKSAAPISDIYGACVLMLRQEDEEYYDYLKDIITQWDIDYLPNLLREREWRLSNYYLFQEYMYSLSSLLLPLAEEMFFPWRRKNHSVSFSEYQCQLLEDGVPKETILMWKWTVQMLFNWYDHYIHNVDHSDESMIRDDMLLDNSYTDNAELLKDFDDPFTNDFLQSASSGRYNNDKHLFYTFDLVRKYQISTPVTSDNNIVAHRKSLTTAKKSLINNDSNTLNSVAAIKPGKESIHPRFNPGILVYGMYLLHCASCSLQCNACLFPGCGYIRIVKQSLEDEESISNDHSYTPNYQFIRYSGGGALEKAIKIFFTDCRSNLSVDFKQDNQMSPSQLKIITLYDEIKDEQCLDKQSISSHEIRGRVNITHLLNEIRLERELRASVFQSNALLAAERELKYVEMKKHLGELIYQLGKNIESGPPVINTISKTENTATMQNSNPPPYLSVLPNRLLLGSANNEAGKPETKRLSPLFAEKSNLVVRLLDQWKCEGDLSLDVLVKMADRMMVPIVDPYPSSLSNESEEGSAACSSLNAMPMPMFCFIMQHLRLSKKQEILQARHFFMDDDGKAHATVRCLAWDRLLEEGLMCLPDGKILLLQVLYGCASQLSLLIEQTSGGPVACFRFVALSAIPSLVSGVTLSVYDIHSKVTRAVYVTENMMRTFSESYKIPSSSNVSADDQLNYAMLAKGIMSHASNILHISRIEEYFVSAEINVSKKEEKVYVKDPSIDDNMMSNETHPLPQVVSLGKRAVIRNGLHRAHLIQRILSSKEL